jgi:mannose-1-phosphate guanylyltransferase
MGEMSGKLLKAVILVGGEGTRLQPLTYYMPKPMVPVVNRPFLEHTIAYLKEYGIKDVILTLSYLPDVIQGYFADGRGSGVNLTYAMEENPLGTAGAVKNTEQYLDGTFVVLNGDIFTALNLTDIFTFHRSKGAKVTIALTWVDDPSAFGVVETDSTGRVQRFIEKPSPDKVTSNWINAGVYIIEPEVLEHVPVNTHYMFEKGLFPLLLERGEPVYAYSLSGYWLDMGTPEKYLRLNHDLLLSEAKSHLIHGLNRDRLNLGENVFIHPSVEISGPVVIGGNCRISQGVRIKGPVVIGPDCIVGEGVSIEKTVLWKSVDIGSGAKIKRCVVSSDIKLSDDTQIINRVFTSSDTVML